MKSYGKEGKPRSRHRECLIVDGYNVLGQLHRLEQDAMEFDASRRELLDQLKEYRAFSGDDVILVFDAHLTKQQGNEYTEGGVRVVFTAASETADARIERLVYEMRDQYRKIMVATSDYAEQQVAFGGGALRIPSSELIRKIKDAQLHIRKQVGEDYSKTRSKLFDNVRQDIANILEKWRRE